MIKWVGSVGMVVSYCLVFPGSYLMVFTGGKVGDFNGNVLYGLNSKTNAIDLLESLSSQAKNIRM